MEMGLELLPKVDNSQKDRSRTDEVKSIFAELGKG